MVRTGATARPVTRPAPAPRVPISIERSRLEAGKAGRSELGRVFLRQQAERVFTSVEKEWLAHELAHQFLLQACPVASDDVLFHEAFAITTSGGGTESQETVTLPVESRGVAEKAS